MSHLKIFEATSKVLKLFIVRLTLKYLFGYRNLFIENNWTQGLIHFYVQAMLLQLSLQVEASSYNPFRYRVLQLLQLLLP